MAIIRPTVLIVGAGASCELGFPSSEKLLKEIGHALDFKISINDVTNGDREIYIQLLRDSANRTNELVRAAWQVRDATHLGISVDNIVHQLQDNDDVAFCAKLAIVRKILQAEKSSELRVHDNRLKITWPAVRGTWLGGLAQMIVQDRQRHDLDGLFTNLKIICFNYDRNIQQFLPLALASQFAIPEPEANVLAQRLEIIHPYGSIGPLEWENRSHSVPYGTERCDLSKAASNIRTFTEQAQDAQSIDIMREALGHAERIIFLGFGFLPQNMELLLRRIDGQAKEVYGTSFGLSEPDRSRVTNQLGILFPETHRSYNSARLVDAMCAPFLQEHFRTFTS